MTTPCFPPCSPWCDCVRGQCVQSPITINAVRFRTPDGRFLQAANGGGGLMVAASVPAAGPAETFSFVPPASWPLISSAAIALDVFNSGWSPSGLRVRVDHNVFYLPPRPPAPTFRPSAPATPQPCSSHREDVMPLPPEHLASLKRLLESHQKEIAALRATFNGSLARSTDAARENGATPTRSPKESRAWSTSLI